MNAPNVYQLPYRDSERMRSELREVMNRFGESTVAEMIGVLELLKAELIERLRRSQ